MSKETNILTAFASSELLAKLKSARVVLARMRRSMSAHPDCTVGSEFDDITTESQVLEDEIEELIKSIEG